MAELPDTRIVVFFVTVFCTSYPHRVASSVVRFRLIDKMLVKTITSLVLGYALGVGVLGYLTLARTFFDFLAEGTSSNSSKQISVSAHALSIISADTLASSPASCGLKEISRSLAIFPRPYPREAYFSGQARRATWALLIHVL